MAGIERSYAAMIAAFGSPLSACDIQKRVDEQLAPWDGIIWKGDLRQTYRLTDNSADAAVNYYDNWDIDNKLTRQDVQKWVESRAGHDQLNNFEKLLGACQAPQVGLKAPGK